MNTIAKFLRKIVISEDDLDQDLIPIDKEVRKFISIQPRFGRLLLTLKFDWDIPVWCANSIQIDLGNTPPELL